MPRNDGDTIACPDPKAPTVSASAAFTIGPVAAGAYQLRGFYDRDGDFSPVLKIHNLPTAGDIGGAAVSNAGDIARGGAADFEVLTLGTDANHDGVYEMPNSGALIEGVTVTLGQTLATPRPVFSFAGVVDERPTTLPNGSATPPFSANTDPAHVVLATDERFALSPTANPGVADQQFLRVVFTPSLPAGAERDAAAAPPYELQVDAPADTFFLSAAPDGAGGVLAIPERSPLPIAALFPNALFAKLDERDATLQTAQSTPAVVLQGLVLRQGHLISTLVASLQDANGAPKPAETVDSLTVALRPAVVCFDPSDPRNDVLLVTPDLNALDGEVVVTPDDAIAGLARIFGGRSGALRVVDGCLPKGAYQANLVYPSGQAWSVPNEGGACIGLETPSGGRCVQRGGPGRALLGSQETVLKVGAEREAGYCAQKHVGDAAFVAGIPRACLRPDEIAAVHRHTP